MNPQPFAFFRGHCVPLEDAKLSVLTQSLHYGTACFGGIRANWDAVNQQFCLFRIRDHYRRQLDACRILNICLPYSIDDLVEFTVETVRRTGYRENLYCRPLAYKSSETISLQLNDLEDDFLVIVIPRPAYLGSHGVKCCTSSWRRISDDQLPPRGKISGAYVNGALAKTDAIRSGYDEAIMLNASGHVSEGTGQNVFMAVGGQLITPPPVDSILLGITRDTTLHLAREDLGIRAAERTIDRSELYVADEVFLTGTATNIAPVVSVDDRPVGDGKTGPITSALQALFGEVALGRNPKYSEWYTILKC